MEDEIKTCILAVISILVAVGSMAAVATTTDNYNTVDDSRINYYQNEQVAGNPSGPVSDIERLRNSFASKPSINDRDKFYFEKYTYAVWYFFGLKDSEVLEAYKEWMKYMGSYDGNLGMFTRILDLVGRRAEEDGTSDKSAQYDNYDKRMIYNREP